MISPIGEYLFADTGTAHGDFGTRLHALVSGRLPQCQNPLDLWNRAKPTMESRANLSVFLYELSDLKRMFEVLPVKHFGKKWKDIFRYRGGRPASKAEWAKYVNNQHLNAMFGWRPFISDLKKFYRGISDFDQRFCRFVNNADKDLMRHRSSSPTTTELNVSWTCPYETTLKATLVGTVTSSYSAAFQFSYHVPDYSPDELRWRAWLDTLGAQVSLANIWAVIPWSFVVDWFVNVGKTLDSNTESWIEPELNMHQAYFSSKWTYDVSLKVTPQGAWSGPTAQAGRITGSKYVRSVGMPQFHIETPDLDANKIRLLASLGLSLIL